MEGFLPQDFFERFQALSLHSRGAASQTYPVPVPSDAPARLSSTLTLSFYRKAGPSNIFLQIRVGSESAPSCFTLSSPPDLVRLRWKAFLWVSGSSHWCSLYCLSENALALAQGQRILKQARDTPRITQHILAVWSIWNLARFKIYFKKETKNHFVDGRYSKVPQNHVLRNNWNATWICLSSFLLGIYRQIFIGVMLISFYFKDIRSRSTTFFF